MRKLSIPALLAFALYALAACDNPIDPGDDHDDHEHHAPEVVAVYLDDELVAKAGYEPGTVEGELRVAAGGSLEGLRIVFLDDHGHELDEEDDHWLEVDIDDEAVAEFVPSTPGGFEGTFTGLEAGETAVAFSLMHGSVGHGHADFKSRRIPVIVTDPADD